MKCNVEKVNVILLKKENGEKLVVLPSTIIRFVVDANTQFFDKWFSDKYYNLENNTYVFDMRYCDFEINKVSGILVDDVSVFPTISYKSIIDFSIISPMEEIEQIRYALEYLHDADLSEYGDENVKFLEKVMDKLGIKYIPF